MKSRKRVLIGDIIWWGLLALITTALCIGAAFTPQAWDAVKISLLIGVPVLFWAIVIAIGLHHRFKKPDIELDTWIAGTYVEVLVWTGGCPISRVETAAALCIFVESFLDPARVAKALDGMTIEVRKDPIKNWGRWSWESPKAGVQSGKSIIFHWNVSFSKSAFVHELFHLVDEFVREEYDPEHGNKLWWNRVGEVNRKLAVEGY